MKNIIVTGGAGFLGSNLINALLKDKDVQSIVVVDSFLTGSSANLPANGKLRLITKDVIDVKVGDFELVDQIYHLACPASPVWYERDPVHTIKSAFIGTLNMLEVAKAKEAKILITSTSEVYGDPEVSPQKESYNGNVPINGTRSCYDEGKRAAESLAFDYWRMYRTEIKIARLFNTYGPNMLEDDGRVISNFIVQSLKGLPVTIYGDGSQTRSFCYVDDTVDFLLKFMSSDRHITGPINVGNPVEFTIKEMAEKVALMVGNFTGTTPKFVFNKLPSDDPKQRKPDITKAKELLGWEPSTSLEEGLENTIKYFKGDL